MISRSQNNNSSGWAKSLFAQRYQILGGMFLLTLLTPPLTSATLRTHVFRTISTVNPRPMALGGAFVSVEDDIAALIWNPAAFILYETEVSHRLSVHINPGIPVLLLRKDHQDVADFLVFLGAAVKGVTYSHHWAEMGLLLWEEPLYNPAEPANGRFFDPDHILSYHTHTFGFRIRLAPTVSLGSSGNLYRIKDNHGKSVLASGVNYGVLLKPTKGLEVGLTYFDFPSSLAQLRWDMEGLRDESVNAGISLHPDDETIVALDIRDAGGGENISWNRLRFGFERTIWEYLALRFGYFQAGRQKHDVYSFGLGLSGRSAPGRRALHHNHSGYLANYALLMEEGEQSQRLWHLLSILFCI